MKDLCRERAVAILNGQEAASNPYIGFIVQQCKTLKGEGASLLTALQRNRKEHDDLKQRLAEINGAVRSHIDTLALWLTQQEEEKHDGGNEK